MATLTPTAYVIARVPPMLTNDPAPEVFATVLVALPANDCPVCGKNHREGTAILASHAAKATEQGYLGYDYDNETWVQATGSSQPAVEAAPDLHDHAPDDRGEQFGEVSGAWWAACRTCSQRIYRRDTHGTLWRPAWMWKP
jgi:hypothetical protein